MPSATSRASRCRQVKAAARRTPPATCSTCAASTPSNSLFVDGVRDDGLISRDVLQPRAGRGVHGPDRLGRRPRHRRRLRQHADEERRTSARLPRRSSAYGSADQKRLTADAQPRLPLGEPRQLAEPIGDPPQRACGRTAACPAATRRRARAAAPIAPSLALGLGTLDARDAVRRSSCGRTTCPTTAFPARPGRRAAGADDRRRRGAGRLRPTTTAASATTTTTRRQDSVHRRASSTTSTRDLTLRNQTRYNRRDARSGDHRRFRTSAAFDAATQPGDARAPGQRAREHDHLEPDDAASPVLHRAPAPRRRPPVSSINSEEQVAPALAGLGTRRAGRHLRARTRSIRSRLRAGPHAARRSTGPDEHDRPVRVRHRRPRTRVAGERRPARASTTTPTFRSRRRRRRRDRRPEGARTRFVSGKAGVLFQAHATGNVYVSCGIDGDAARHGQLHAERAAEQPEQPEREAAGVDQLRGRQQVGLRRRPALAERGAVFRTENRERHLHGGRDGDSADLQPGRQPARQRRVDRRRSAGDHDALGGARQRRAISTARSRRRTTPTTATA